MMNKKELTTLIDALRFNTQILNEKLGEQENTLEELLEIQETLACQLRTLEEELENIDIIDKDKELDTDENVADLRVGDYISEPNIDKIYFSSEYTLTQIIKTTDGKYTRLLVDANCIVGDVYNTIDELKDGLHEDAYYYLVEDDFKFTEGRYLVYDIGYGGDYEVVVNYDAPKFEAFLSGGEEFYEEVFDTIEELEHKLRTDFKIVKKLRYSIYG